MFHVAPSRVPVAPGECPGVEGIVSVALGSEVVVDRRLLSLLEEARSVYLGEASRRRIYGYCTGLGDLAGRGGECRPGWEHRVLVEHAVATGPLAPPFLARAFLAARLFQLSSGQAPVRPVVAERIAEALNRGVVPGVPLHGSVGASGDLAPSAHAFLCLFYGEGRAYYQGRLVPCREALEGAGLGTLELEAGEALALINNTAWSTALAGLGVYALERLWEASLESASRILEACRCRGEHYDPGLLASRGHGGVVEAAGRIRASCTGGPGQDPYSLRCTPIVAGAVFDALQYARRLLDREACAPTENPTVHGGRVWHWCGFHAVYPSIAADTAAVAAAHLAGLVERRIAQAMRGELTGLPDYLAGPGSSVGAMIIQYSAAQRAALARWASSPAGVHSIPTSGLQEDVVSMAPNAGLRLLQLADSIAWLVAMERAVARALEAAGRGDYSWRPGDLVWREYEALLGERGLSWLSGLQRVL